MQKTLKAAVLGVVLGVVPCVAHAQLFANAPPPAMQAEQPPPAPGPGFTWIPGFWNWTGNQYAWTPGRWEQPPQPAQTWQAPAWERDGNRFRFRPGRWGQGGMGQPGPVAQPVMPQPAQPVQPAIPVGQPGMHPQMHPQMPGLPPGMQPGMVPPAVNMGGPPPGQTWQSPMAPPRPRAERRAPPPQRGMTWIPGFWSWNCGSNRHEWTPGRWEAPPRARARWEAPRWVRRGRQWVFMPGRWR